jgi:hypothetical protein
MSSGIEPRVRGGVDEPAEQRLAGPATVVVVGAVVEPRAAEPGEQPAHGLGECAARRGLDRLHRLVGDRLELIAERCDAERQQMRFEILERHVAKPYSADR